MNDQFLWNLTFLIASFDNEFLNYLIFKNKTFLLN